jgi:protein-tyrosine-phosphatase
MRCSRRLVSVVKSSTRRRCELNSIKKLGYDLTKHRSKSLTEIPDVEYDFVATMECGDECPFIRAKAHADWAIPDPKNLLPDEYRAVRSLVEKRVWRYWRNSVGDFCLGSR